MGTLRDTIEWINQRLRKRSISLRRGPVGVPWRGLLWEESELLFYQETLFTADSERSLKETGISFHRDPVGEAGGCFVYRQLLETDKGGNGASVSTVALWGEPGGRASSLGTLKDIHSIYYILFWCKICANVYITSVRSVMEAVLMRPLYCYVKYWFFTISLVTNHLKLTLALCTYKMLSHKKAEPYLTLRVNSLILLQCSVLILGAQRNI
jgi:hypothetical protein